MTRKMKVILSILNHNSGKIPDSYHQPLTENWDITTKEAVEIAEHLRKTGIYETI